MTTARTAAAPWTLGAPPADYVLGHVRAVLPGRVLDDARIVVRGGVIEEAGPHPAGTAGDVDGAGLLCLPGLVDTHSDALERERVPRPGAELPLDFALLSLEGKLRAAGITTVFHVSPGGMGCLAGGYGPGRRALCRGHSPCPAHSGRGPFPPNISAEDFCSSGAQTLRVNEKNTGAGIQARVVGGRGQAEWFSLSTLLELWSLPELLSLAIVCTWPLAT